MRLLLAVVAAFVFTGILSTAVDHVFHVTNVYPPYGEPMFDTGLLILASSYRVVFQILGGYIMSVIAKDNAIKAGWIVGALGTILWLSGAFFMRGMGPLWYPVVGAILSIPSVLLGVKLYKMRSQNVIG